MLPLHGLGIAVVMTNVALEFASKIVDAGEDPASDHIALDFAKPKLDLVQPG